MRNLVLTIAYSIRFQPRSVQSEPLRWFLLIGFMLSLSACSTDAEEGMDQAPTWPAEKQALNKWILNYLQEVATDTETIPDVLDKNKNAESARQANSYSLVDTTSLSGSYISWSGQNESDQEDSLTGYRINRPGYSSFLRSSDSSEVIANLLFALPDSLVQRLSNAENDSVLIVDLNITVAGDTVLSREWTTKGDMPPIAIKVFANSRQPDTLTRHTPISVVEVPPNQLLLGAIDKALQNAALGPILDRSSTTTFIVPPPSSLSSLGSFIDRKSDVIEITIPLNSIH